MTENSIQSVQSVVIETIWLGKDDIQIKRRIFKDKKHFNEWLRNFNPVLNEYEEKVV